VIPFLDLKAQYLSIKNEIDDAIARVLESCHFVLGEEVESFEREFASYCGTQYALGVNSGTSALHLALLAGGIKPGDEVITVSFTFVATAAAICYAGARPVFVDVAEGSYTMDPAQIERAITSRTKAIIPVHLYGQCADMEPILEIARRHQLLVIEDAAQAHGAEYKGRPAGSFGDLACFSFYPGKNLGAVGEGGAVATNNSDYVEKIKVLRDQGQSRKYHHEVVGYNYRLEGIQGAVLRVKLRHLDAWNAARREHASTYRKLLRDAGVRLLEEKTYGKPVYHIFPVFSAARDRLQQHLTSNAIATGIHYPIPVHMQPAFSDQGNTNGSLPQSERASKETLSLPMFAELSDDAISSIACAVCEFDR
jgi:dTDP-4-amino-4,6-dideoxygalactose transaminase